MFHFKHWTLGRNKASIEKYHWSSAGSSSALFMLFFLRLHIKQTLIFVQRLRLKGNAAAQMIYERKKGERRMTTLLTVCGSTSESVRWVFKPHLSSRRFCHADAWWDEFKTRFQSRQNSIRFILDPTHQNSKNVSSVSLISWINII